MRKILESNALPECIESKENIMKKIYTSLFIAMALGAGGCNWQGIRGNGHVVTDQRTLEDFSEIYARGGAFNIEWRSGPPSVAITTDENLLTHIETRKIDNRLELRTRERLRPSHGRSISMIVSSSTRSGAKLSGAADLKVSALTGPKFAVESSGAADVSSSFTVTDTNWRRHGRRVARRYDWRERFKSENLAGANGADLHHRCGQRTGDRVRNAARGHHRRRRCHLFR